MAVPAYVEDRIRRDAPSGCHVLPTSTPVVAFGDPAESPVATIGLNPSRIEFEVKGIELNGHRRRFETLTSLGIERLSDCSAEHIERIYQRCTNYFHANPYHWFNRLEEILDPVGASYFADTACHLDLSQWATDPTWNRLPPRAREQLVAEDAEFLATQLRLSPLKVVLLNGRSVVGACQQALGAQVRLTRVVAHGSLTCRIFDGELEGVPLIGWSTNLQSSFGVTREFRYALAEAVADLAARISR